VKKNPAQFVGKSSGIMNRKHRCRISKRHVCDDCSTKRLVEGGVESRVSSQFYWRRSTRARKRATGYKKKAEQDRIQDDVRSQEISHALRLERLEAEVRGPRFIVGGMMEKLRTMSLVKKKMQASR
jgi:hypothetical protein